MLERGKNLMFIYNLLNFSGTIPHYKKKTVDVNNIMFILRFVLSIFVQ